MRTVLRDNAEVAHVWAQQVQGEGRMGNMSFNGSRLFSYRACIGNIVHAQHTGETVALVTNRRYSVTTSHHTGLAWSAVSHIKAIAVYDPDPYGKIDHRVNLTRIRDEIIYAAGKAARAKKEYSRDRWERTRLERGEAFKAYVDLFQLHDMAGAEYAGVMEMDLDAIRAGIAAQASAVEEERKREKKKRMVELRKKLAEWRNGKNVAVYALDFAALRLSPDKTEIETSKGVRVRVRIARRLWQAINSARTQKADLTPDMRIDHYNVTVIKANGDVSIGCHYIPFRESKRMAGILGLDNAVELLAALDRGEE